MLTEALASAFARVALANVEREYPRAIAHVLRSPSDELAPKKAHPAFYGSYDWHSAVHMHWLLARVLRLYPMLAENGRIAALLDSHLSAANLQVELEYLRKNPARMADFVASPYPIRSGSHDNSAFACVLALDYARAAQDLPLQLAIVKAAKRWYGSDRDAPLAYEPSLNDFLSPSLVEAVLMQQVLEPVEFARWLNTFLSAGTSKLEPPVVADRSDAKQSHLDGLCLSRAWCFKALGLADAAERHLAAGLPQVVGGDYVGEHCLASFAMLALSGAALRTP